MFCRWGEFVLEDNWHEETQAHLLMDRTGTGSTTFTMQENDVARKPVNGLTIVRPISDYIDSQNINKHVSTCFMDLSIGTRRPSSCGSDIGRPDSTDVDDTRAKEEKRASPVGPEASADEPERYSGRSASVRKEGRKEHRQ